MDQFFDKLRPVAHNAWRIMIGFAFFTHGGQKIFGWFGASQAADLMSRFGIAGIIEVVGGALIMLGLFTRPTAFICAGEMAVAYWWMHAGRADPFSIWHWDNRGELVLVYCFTWLFLAAIGPGSFSLDAKLLKTRGKSPSQRP
jgi:putative oxidoreductase